MRAGLFLIAWVVALRALAGHEGCRPAGRLWPAGSVWEYAYVDQRSDEKGRTGRNWSRSKTLREDLLPASI